MKLLQYRNNCIGCTVCMEADPNHWKIGRDGKAILIGSKKKGKCFVKEIHDVGGNKTAERDCPVNIIRIIE